MKHVIRFVNFGALMNRRRFVTKVLGMASVLCSSKALAKIEFTWPSDSAVGSIQKQTDELVDALRRGLVVNCRPGVFVINNPIKMDVKDLDIRGSQGSEKTELHFLHADQGGLAFRKATNINISDVHLYWKPVDKKARHHGGAGLMLVNSTRISILRSSVHGAPGAGFHFNKCNHVNAVELFVENTLGDGIHFQNTSNCHGYRLTTSHTGDDGVAIVDYAKYPISHGFYLEKIRVVGSKARGIAFVGARDGVLKDFFIDKTATNGLHIEQDRYYKTRFPENIQVFSGVIDGTGNYKPLRSNKFGINVLRARNITLKNVDVMNSLKFACLIKDSQNIALTGCNFTHSRGASLYIQDAFNVQLNNIYLTGTYTPFFQAIGVSGLSAKNLTILDQTNVTKVTAIVLYRTKTNLLKNIHITDLVLEAEVIGDKKEFIIKASGVRDVSIDYISQHQVNVLGGGRNLSLSKKQDSF